MNLSGLTGDEAADEEADAELVAVAPAVLVAAKTGLAAPLALIVAPAGDDNPGEPDPESGGFVLSGDRG